MSTTGKTTIGDRLRTNTAVPVGTPVLDSDRIIAERILQDNLQPRIARVFITLGRGEALRRIEEEERRFLIENSDPSRNAIFALGPNMGIRLPEWTAFRRTVTLVLIRKNPLQIQEDLTRRREGIRERFPTLAENPNFGTWDIGVAFDEQLRELSQTESLRLITEITNRVNASYAPPDCDTTFDNATRDIVDIIQSS